MSHSVTSYINNSKLYVLFIKILYVGGYTSRLSKIMMTNENDKINIIKDSNIHLSLLDDQNSDYHNKYNYNMLKPLIIAKDKNERHKKL